VQRARRREVVGKGATALALASALAAAGCAEDTTTTVPPADTGVETAADSAFTVDSAPPDTAPPDNGLDDGSTFPIYK
jgi:hypothetical protein